MAKEAVRPEKLHPDQINKTFKSVLRFFADHKIPEGLTPAPAASDEYRLCPKQSVFFEAPGGIFSRK